MALLTDKERGIAKAAGMFIRKNGKVHAGLLDIVNYHRNTSVFIYLSQNIFCTFAELKKKKHEYSGDIGFLETSGGEQ